MHQHSQDGHDVALEWAPEAQHHVLPDELVEGLDSIERTIEGDEEGQHDLVEQVQPRDSGPMALQVEEIKC